MAYVQKLNWWKEIPDSEVAYWESQGFERVHVHGEASEIPGKHQQRGVPPKQEGQVN